MDGLTLLGLLSVTAMLVWYALDNRSPRFVLGCAVACMWASAYGFLHGAWPFGIIEAICGIVARRRWRVRRSHQLTVIGLPKDHQCV
jgi:hypothetical protein